MKSRQPTLVRARLLFIGALALVVLLGALWVFGPSGPARTANFEPTPTLAAAPAATFAPPPDLGQLARQFPRLENLLTNPALDSVYKEFLVAYESGGVEAAEVLARQRGLLTPENHIRVTLVLDTEDSSALVGELRAIGVIVRGTYRDLIDIGIPLDLIAQTAEAENPGAVFDRITQLEHVIGLQLPTPNPSDALQTRRPHQPAKNFAGLFQLDTLVSEGVATLGAEAWHTAGYTGHGIKIGILDQGFDGYREQLGVELPEVVVAASFVPNVEPHLTGSNHGTAVAEIVHDTAPGAELFLAHYDGGDVSMGNAVEWLLQQGVQIITHSAGGLAAPMDGTGRDAELVNEVAAAGVLWINSAGNAATQHYRSLYTDTDGDLVHEFLPQKTTLSFQASSDTLTQIILNWDDWHTGQTQDLDLYVQDADGNIIAAARNTRDGQRPPVEQILYQFEDSRTYFVTINGVVVERPLRLDLYIHQTPNMELAEPIGSLATPGDAAGALTVGAVYWRTDELEPFSSRGPTADGRIKPDLVGPDGVVNSVFAPERFFGTSAAAPHLAGLAALTWNAYPQSSAAEIRGFLIANTVDLLTQGPDDNTGAGVALLPEPPLPPTPTPTLKPDEPTPTPQPSATPRKIVIATPGGTRPRPTVSPEPAGFNFSGLIVIGAAVFLGLFAGWRMTRRRSSPRRAAPAPTRSASAAPTVRCAHCDRVLPAAAAFCPQCGRPQATPAPACRRCGHVLRPGAAYCGHCGEAAN